MKVKASSEVEGEVMEMEGAKGVKRWVLISGQDGAPNFVLRRFRVEPGGETPYHQHPFEHEIFILAGRGWLRGEKGESELVPGSAAFVPPDELHQFCASPETTLEFLCIVPRRDSE
jgi:quercetin dioxygenase-like cupin family protein